MLDPRQQEIMNLVEQVELLPPEVLDIVAYRKAQSDKSNKKLENDTKDEMSQMYDLMQKFKVQKPVQAPAPQADMISQLLGQSLGEVDPGLMI